MTKKTFNQQKERKRFIPRIVDSYKKSTTLEKATGFLSLLVLAVALVFNIGENPLNLALIAVGIFAVVNLFVYKANLTMSALILAAHISSIPYLASLYGYFNHKDGEVDSFSPFIVLSLATFAFAVLAYRFCRGRYWISLALVLLGLGFGGLITALELNLTWGVAPGVILASLMVLFRAVPWRATFRKNDNFISPTLANSSQDSLTAKLFHSKKYSVSELPNLWPLSHVAYSQKRVFLVSTFTPSKALVINKNRFYYDGAFIEPMIFEIAKTAEEWCRENKVDAKYVTTVALINNKVYFPSSDTLLSIKIAEKGKQHTEAQLHLVTPEGLDELLEQEVPHLPYKVFQSIQKTFPNG